MKTNHPAEGWLTPGGSMEAGTQLDEGRGGPGARGPGGGLTRYREELRTGFSSVVNLWDPSELESCPFMCEEAGKCFSVLG